MIQITLRRHSHRLNSFQSNQRFQYHVQSKINRLDWKKNQPHIIWKFSIFGLIRRVVLTRALTSNHAKNRHEPHNGRNELFDSKKFFHKAKLIYEIFSLVNQ